MLLIKPTVLRLQIGATSPTSRSQGPSKKCSSVTIQAKSTNAGSIYIGGDDVTNASGVADGLELAPGDVISNISIENMNHVYFAGDTTGDWIKVLVV